MNKLSNRELTRDMTKPYQWVTPAPRTVRYAPPMRMVSGIQLVTWLALLAGIVAIMSYAMDAKAEPMPNTMTTQCKDGVVAHDVIGDWQAPCRKHGGTAAVAEGGKPGEPDFVPVGTDDSDFHYIAACTDGAEYWATGKSKKGACEGHGGVKAWADGKPVKHRAVKAYRKGGAK